MDTHPILDHDDEVPESNASDSQADVRFPGEDGGRSLTEMAERDLTATLQLLAERAQYITGATGAAIALRDRQEMVCRASAGPSAPEVGAQLQVNSGLSGESVRTRQTLRCDDSFTDERVNRESCEALGIRSVVVMPLLRGDEVIGVFELFSDRANVFETRDLAALERMGAMVHTALEHSAAALGLQPLPPDQTTRPSLPDAGNGHHGESLETPPTGDQDTGAIPAGAQEPAFSPSNANDVLDIPSSSTYSGPGVAFHMKMPSPAAPAPLPARVETATAAAPAEIPAEPMADEGDILEEAEAIPATPPASESSDDILIELAEVSSQAQRPPDDRLSASGPVSTQSTAEAAGVTTPPSPEPRGAVAQLRKCEACGFPISEGRQLCLDCEKKSPRLAPPAAPAAAVPAARIATPSYDVPVEASMPDIGPNFLAGGDQEASWLSTHKLAVVAIALALVGIVVVVLLR